jgi:hypothetical protein
MVKKIRYQEIRTSRRRPRGPRSAWVLEPLDGALIGAALLAVAWLQWISHTS